MNQRGAAPLTAEIRRGLRALLEERERLRADAFHRHVACVGGCSVCDLVSGARCPLMSPSLDGADDAAVQWIKTFAAAPLSAPASQPRETTGTET